MAENENTEAEAGEEESGKKKSGLKLIIIVAALLLVLGGGGAAAYFLLLAEPSGGGQEGAEDVAVHLPAIYTKIRSLEGRPMFVVPLRSKKTKVGRGHYMQAYVEAKTRDPAVEATLKLHMPVIVSRLNRVFAAQEFEVLQTSAGRDALRQSATDAVREVMMEKIGKPGVESVLFTNFVMQ
ncbi:MAG: flagellar basal body-associated FliL family protein [Pontibacterium sp.]